MRLRMKHRVCLRLLSAAMVVGATRGAADEPASGGPVDDVRKELGAIRQLLEQLVLDARASQLRQERQQADRSIALIGGELQRAARTRLELGGRLADEQTRLDAYRQALVENNSPIEDLLPEQRREVESLERFVDEQSVQLEQLQRWEDDLERMLQRNRELRDAIPVPEP